MSITARSSMTRIGFSVLAPDHVPISVAAPVAKFLPAAAAISSCSCGASQSGNSPPASPPDGGDDEVAREQHVESATVDEFADVAIPGESKCRHCMKLSGSDDG